ncbi:centrosomal protein of 68 kDa isoform X1 [Alosa pseudoharengus]|uniref:centrosomal protein of 68 kDa isoform X1 n=1 Tax=Alosa pseudoharengus TaxID=34774 RepID=UPI003F8A6840
MTLGVDRKVPETLCQMEQTGRWRTRIPEFVRSGHAHKRSQAPGDRERTQSTPSNGAKDSDKERNSNKKTVTMAPMSRCMTSKGQYIARRPLVSTERHTSILKNPLSHELTVQEKHQTGFTRDTLLHNERESHSHRGFKDTLTCPSPSKSYGLSPSVSREDLTSPLTTADLRTWSTCEEPSFRSTSSQNTPSKKHSRRSLSSPPMDVYSLTVPLSPKFSSTQRSTQTPPSRPSRKTDADLMYVPEPALRSSSKVSPPPFHQMSPYQANYWTCAIPTSLPPSPDRRSPNWDPDKEYQALLDYTYPLRPGHTSKRDSVDLGSHLKTDMILEDSGIELDRFCSSSTLSCLDQSVCARRGKGGNPQSANKPLGLHGLSSRELSQSKSSDGRLSSSLYSVDHIGLSVESLECDGKQQSQQWFHYKKLGVFSTSRSPSTFIPTLHVLPRPGLLGDSDEEFLALPDRLQEIQALSQHLKDISAQISQPATSSWESLERETSSTEKQSGETTVVQEEDGDTVEEEEEGEGSVSGGLPRIEEPLEEMFESRLHMLSTEVNQSSVREMASIMDRLGGVSLSELRKSSQMDQEDADTKESLMQHIQTFCANLQELIQWLYRVVHKMEVLTPPSVDIESVKTSLTDYKNFQRDVQAHRPLTGAVLHTGEALLRCMNSTSPVLKETLELIERQSRALETHAEHLFSSILSAMDSLTEASSKEGTECSD